MAPERTGTFTTSSYRIVSVKHLYTGNDLRLRGREECHGGGTCNATQHQTLVVDPGLGLEQSIRFRTVGVLRQEHHQDTSALRYT